MSDFTIKSYLKDISQYTLLSFDEEQKLAALIKQKNTQAKEALINHNLRLVVFIAKKYLGFGLSLADLIQEGNLGLIKAVEKYDLNKGFRFSTYATYWIKQSISKAIMDQGRNIRIPIHTIVLLNQIAKVERDFLQKNNRFPSIQEISKIIHVDINKIKQAKEWEKDTTSLDLIIGDDENLTIGELIEDSSVKKSFQEVESDNLYDDLYLMLETLTEREKNVIMRRFGIKTDNPQTLEEIGRDLKISKERVRQIENSALKKLRNPKRIKILRNLLDNLD